MRSGCGQGIFEGMSTGFPDGLGRKLERERYPNCHSAAFDVSNHKGGGDFSMIREQKEEKFWWENDLVLDE